jgi:hypothetical protein
MSRPTSTLPPPSAGAPAGLDAVAELDEPGPDAPISEAEAAAAAAFGVSLDAASTPLVAVPAPADELRALAVAIQAVHGKLELDAPTRTAIVESALARAVGGTMPAPADQLAARRARRASAVAPLAALGAALAVAAGLVVMLGSRGTAPVAPPVAASAPAPIPASWRSRPTDALVGEIGEAARAGAADRVGLIFRDRMDAFRARSLAGGGR